MDLPSSVTWNTKVATETIYNGKVWVVQIIKKRKYIEISKNKYL